MSAPYQLLPPLSGEEYAQLRADIDANGVVIPVLVDEYANIIDGHHRAHICEELGVGYEVEVVAGLSDHTKRRMAVDLNLHRRQLTREQKRDVLAALIKAEPEKSDRQHAEAAGVSDKTAGAVRRELESGAEIPHLESRAGADGKAYPAQAGVI